ncbi:hypothetical protein M3E78_005155 [Micrococcus luteus]|nr:hypothetical protein [Micrococcus luteus]MCV7573656.1 hypothetical protein [Micrococcus luteus]
MTALAVVETGEVVEAMSTVEAERITARIADKLDAIADNLEQVLPLIGEALTRRAWEVLGYASPTAYVAERFAGALDRLSPEVRRPVVAQLSAAGMSTRAIAPVVGVTHKTVVKDSQAVREVVPEVPPAPVEPAALPESTAVVGMDGKTYPRPEAPALADDAPAPKTKRAPLRKSVDDAAWNLRRATERLARVVADDRFDPQKSEMATLLRGHLEDAVSVCQDLLDRINTPEGA